MKCKILSGAKETCYMKDIQIPMYLNEGDANIAKSC